MKFAPGVPLIAGSYGILVPTLLYFLKGLMDRQTPPPIADSEYFYGFTGVGLA